MKKANDAKQEIEESQRQIRKQRETEQKPFVPEHFNLTKDNFYIYKDFDDQPYIPEKK